MACLSIKLYWQASRDLKYLERALGFLHFKIPIDILP